MMIDCHTHIFPDRIAPKVLKQNRLELCLEPYGLCTTKDLFEYMDAAGIDYAVAFGVAPEARLVKPTNDWLVAQSHRRLLLFGTVTPDYEDWESEIDRLKAAGVVGVKFNPLYQRIVPDDRIMYPMYEKLKQERMFVYFHSGKGGNQRESSQVRATPARLRRVVDDHPGLKLICAHLGGNDMLEDVLQYLVGTDVYLDTSYTPSCKVLDSVEVTNLIKRHGTDRVLYATDYPWAKQGKDHGWEYQWLLGLDLPEADKELILGQNARRLFDLYT